jgi:hypothetical protein
LFTRSSVLTNPKFIIPTSCTMSARLKIRHIRKCMNGVTIPSHSLAVFQISQKPRDLQKKHTGNRMHVFLRTEP